MHSKGRKRGQADGDVFRSLRARRTVSDPLPARSDDRFTSMHLEHACFRFYLQHPIEYQRIFVEFRRLPRLAPSGRTLHSGDADLCRAAVHQPNKLLDALWLIARSLNHRRFFNFDRHEVSNLLLRMSLPSDCSSHKSTTLNDMGALARYSFHPSDGPEWSPATSLSPVRQQLRTIHQWPVL